jgi:hypothetical protein
MYPIGIAEVYVGRLDAAGRTVSCRGDASRGEARGELVIG